MPIRPENRGGLSVPLRDVLSPSEYRSVETLRAGQLGDPARFYGLWEGVVARHTGGRLTPTGHGWDVQLGSIRVEVKFAAECIMRFGQGARQVFRFVSLRGSSRSNASTVVVLIGLDRRDLIHAWVIPTAVIGDTDACTLNNPDRAVGDSRSRFSPYRVPFDQLLPEILSAHREHHAQTAQRTRTAALEAQMDALFEVGSA